jgi:geranylgeranylglycerol-phosphate geranylgeranyltransferase
MLAIAVLIGETIALGALPPLTFVIILSLLVPIFSEMGSFALNDYLDVETDKLNKREDRPLVSGEISKDFAFWFSLTVMGMSIICGWFINIYAFWIALVFNLLAIAYNYKLKDLPVLGNAYIGLSMAIPFAFGFAVVKDSLLLTPTVFVLFIMAFLAGLAREIVKSVEDMEGDKKARGSKTLPIVIGEKNARILAAALLFAFAPLAALPFTYGLSMNLLPVLVVAFADLGMVWLAWLVFSKGDKKTLKKVRKLSLAFMFLGLVGILIAALI